MRPLLVFGRPPAGSLVFDKCGGWWEIFSATCIVEPLEGVVGFWVRYARITTVACVWKICIHTSTSHIVVLNLDISWL